MPLDSFEGRAPHVHADAFVAPSATLVGDVTIDAGASIWYGAVIVATGAIIPDGVLAAGAPAEVRRAIEGTPSEVWVKANPQAYRELAARHREGRRPV